MKISIQNKILGTALLLTVLTGAMAQQVSGTDTVTATTLGTGTIGIAGGSNRKTVRPEDLKTKEISQEVGVPKGGEIYIENAYRSVQVKTWEQQKVKITVTAYYEGEDKGTNEEWLEKMNISLKTMGTSVKLKSGVSGVNNYSVGSSGVTNSHFYSYSTIDGISSLKRTLTVYVPADSKLDIESKYADVQLPGGITDINLDITNGNLEAENINKLVLRSKYSNANIGDIKSAEIEFVNGRFSARTIDDLDIDTKYSTVELVSAKKVIMRSTNDEYELEDVDDIQGRKNYGNLRITRLAGSIDLEGSNADVRIRNLGANANSIKLNNKYADIRIPLRNSKNYSIDFAGAYSSVYGNFEKKPVITITPADKLQKDEKISAATINAGSGRMASSAIAPGAPTITKVSDGTTVIYDGNKRIAVNGTATTLLGSQGNLLATQGNLSTTGVTWVTGRDVYTNSDTPSKFTAVVGDGKGLKIDLKCQNCTIDFK